MSSRDTVWKEYIKMHRRAAHFRNKGFHLFQLLEEMMLLHAKGSYVFHPGNNHPRPAQTAMSEASMPIQPSVTPSLSFAPQPFIASNFSPPTSLSSPSAPPSAPSTFLSPSSDSSSFMTSVSRGKRKSSDISGAASVINTTISEETQKRAHGPSAAVTAQLEHAGAMKSMSGNFESMSKAFAKSGITMNTDIYMDAMAKLNRHIHDVSMDDFMKLSKHFTSPDHKQDAIIFTGIEDVSYCKHWLELCLEEIKWKAA
ncbi:hypothetical protein EDD17DRAFT_1508691 [Pisolithus thermaeus]|nr:hypothetical protein EDD17DRAFT_1508691 [Pisolithus thermaeus]